VGPAVLRAKVYADLKLDLVSADIAALLEKFDPDNSGSINLCKYCY
jgi:hypothetical protein